MAQFYKDGKVANTDWAVGSPQYNHYISEGWSTTPPSAPSAPTPSAPTPPPVSSPPPAQPALNTPPATPPASTPPAPGASPAPQQTFYKNGQTATVNASQGQYYLAAGWSATPSTTSTPSAPTPPVQTPPSPAQAPATPPQAPQTAQTAYQPTLIEITSQRPDVLEEARRQGGDPYTAGTAANTWLNDWYNRVGKAEGADMASKGMFDKPAGEAAPPTPTTPQPTAYDTYIAQLEAIEKRIEEAQAAHAQASVPTEDELLTEKQLNDLIASGALGEAKAGDQPIAMPFITGQQAAIQRQVGYQSLPLKSKLGYLQAKRQAATDVKKSELEYETGKATRGLAPYQLQYEQELRSNAPLTLAQKQDQANIDRKFEEDKRQYGLNYALKEKQLAMSKAKGTGGGYSQKELNRIAEKKETEFWKETKDAIKNRLAKGEPWGTVWKRIKTRFSEIPDEVIDQALGGGKLPNVNEFGQPVSSAEENFWGWARPGAYEEYKAGQGSGDFSAVEIRKLEQKFGTNWRNTTTRQRQLDALYKTDDRSNY